MEESNDFSYIIIIVRIIVGYNPLIEKFGLMKDNNFVLTFLKTSIPLFKIPKIYPYKKTYNGHRQTFSPRRAKGINTTEKCCA